jgi:hypothetical protein
MEKAQITAALVAQPSGALSAELQRSAGLLSGSAGRELAALMAQMVSHYPHQELAEETLMSYTHDLAAMAQEHGMVTVKAALLTVRRRPGQRFFPHPTEVAEELEAMKQQLREAQRISNPYIPDPACKHTIPGWKRTKDVDGDDVMSRCDCWKA